MPEPLTPFFQAQLVMLLWLPAALLLFRFFSSRKAVIICFLVAWLFLPQRAGYLLPGLPDYARISATCYSILLATFLFDSQRLKSFKFSWIDIPMLVWCVCSLITSISNGLGAYDGFSNVVSTTVKYGIPYFLGRIYLNDLAGLRLLAISMFISGLVYAPLCWFESVMSPQLHRLVYGYHGIHEFNQSIRLGGYRPNVFMVHGLSVGMWMMAVTLIAMWLSQAGVLKKFLNIPMNLWIAGLIFTHILVRSTGAYLYMIFGLVILFSAKWFRTSLPVVLLIVSIWSYLYLAATGNFTGEQADQIVAAAEQITGSADRAGSLQFRFDNEEMLVERAQERMIFGWGGWDRNRVFDYNWAGERVDISVTDSLWVIAFGINGMVGLISVYGSFLLPAFVFTVRYPARTWFHPKVAPAAMITAVIVLYGLDNCLNNQPNPVFTVASGAIAGLLTKQQSARKIPPSVRRGPKLPASRSQRVLDRRQEFN